MSAAIELRGVGKRYRTLSEDAMLLRSIVPWTRPRVSETWALRDIELTVAAGEIVGVVGHNGAGKTTLLRLLAGVTRPTVGRVHVAGRIAPLIGLGIGFAEEMSGRENVIVNGMMLGMSAAEIGEHLESIVDFAELRDFIDTPVKFYSSGMLLRLGFAVIAHTNPAILLVDEILAVGDAGFQLKCFERLREFQRDGAAIVMVSHAMYQIRALCPRTVLISHGHVELDGDTERVIARHETLAGAVPEDPDFLAGGVTLLDSRLIGGEGEDNRVAYDQPVELRLRLRFDRRIRDPQVRVGVVTSRGGFGGFDVSDARRGWRTFEAGEETEVRITFPVRLAGGGYELPVEIREAGGGRIIARFRGPRLTVLPEPGAAGMLDLAAHASIERS